MQTDRGRTSQKEFPGTDVREANLPEADLEGADLSGVNFKGSGLSEVRLARV